MKKNILNIITQTEIIGGVERTLETSDKVLNKKYNIYYLKSFGNKNKLNIEGEILSLNEKNHKKNIIQLFFLLIKRAYIYKKICDKYKINYSISYGDFQNFSNILSKVLFRNKGTIIIMLQSSLSFYKSRKTYFIYKFFFKYLYRNADIVITGSKEMKKSIIKNGLENVYNIYNPLDINDINFLKKEATDYDILFENGKKTFINIGRLTEVKNQKFLIKIFNKFNTENPDYQLIIIGDGELKNELSEYINGLENKNNIHILGFYNNIYSFINKSDFFIFSSYSEGFGRVLIESNICGIPIITHDFKYGAKEIIRNNNNLSKCIDIENHENGILVPYMDEEKFLEGMQVLIKQEWDKEKIIQNCSKYNMDNFEKSWNKVLNKK